MSGPREMRRRVLCASAAFKGTLSAAEASAAMARGAARGGVLPWECDVCPVADGGDGSLDAIEFAAGGSRITRTVPGPLGEPVVASYLLTANGRGAAVELAAASGLTLVPPSRRDPTRASTFGTGVLVADAVKRGCREVVVFLGGSATIDGGTGLAQAIGVRFFDASGRLMTEPLCGGALERIARVEAAPDLPAIRACRDVDNPLLGPRGAAAVYGPQKGATPEAVRRLEAGLRHLARLAEAAALLPGAGAAGGAGFGLVAFCGATLQPGADVILDAIGFEERCRRADLLLTGEGRLDVQTLWGKAVMAVARRAGRLGVPVVAIVGSCGDGAEASLAPRGPLAAVVSLAARYGIERAMREPAALLEEAAAGVVGGG